MFRTSVLFSIFLSLVLATEEAGLQYKFNGQGSSVILRAVLSSSGEVVEVVPSRSGAIDNRPLFPASDSGYVLWVDRNHRYGIAENLVISGDGRYIFANWWLNSQRVSLYDVLGTSTPLWEYSSTFVWNRGQSIGSSLSGAALSAVTATTVYKWAKDSANPQWSFDYPGYSGKSAIVSENGSVVVSACEAGVDKKVYVFNAQTGESLWTASFTNSRAIQGLDISDNGQIVVVTTYDTCFVFENGTQRGNAILIGSPTSGTQYPAMISGDGSVLITGDFYGRLRKYNWNGSNYVQHWMYQYPTGTYYNWICGKAISKDGSKILIGVLDFGNGSNYDNSCAILLDSSSNVPRWFCHRYGDMVEATALSANGAYGVAGSWGMYNSTFGDVISVFDTQDSVPIFSVLDDIDEPGSIHTVDMSSDGQYIAAGGKAVHARQSGNGGEVYAIRVVMTLIKEHVATKMRAAKIMNVNANPFKSKVLIEIADIVPAGSLLRIYNTSGQLVTEFRLPGKSKNILWDGKDSADRQLPSGVYTIAIEANGRLHTKNICRLR